jgi:RNA polymerase sigma factor (sigma-70 family)
MAGELVKEPRPASAATDGLAPGAAPPGLTDLYRVHYRSLVRMAGILLGDLGAAEEVTQDAFLAAHRASHRLRDETRLLDYVRSAVLNGARSRLRRRRVAALWMAKAPRSTVAPDPSVLGDDRATIVRALRQLPTRQRECLLLATETAGALGISPGAVKQHLHRALATIAALLEVER